MSEQYTSLDPTAKYLAIKASGTWADGGSDPFASWNDSKIKNMSVSLPNVEYPHIFCFSTCKQHQLYPESHSESQPSTLPEIRGHGI